MEDRLCHLCKNWLMKLKCPLLQNMPSEKKHQNYWSFYPSEPFTIAHFNVRHPVLRALWKEPCIYKNEQSSQLLTLIRTLHTVVLWLICRHRELGNSTYMKVILTKNLAFINIIYHRKFQFAKMSWSLGKCSIFCYIKVTEIKKITLFS